MQAGYKRCLFFSCTASVIKKLCSVFMVREYLRVPLLMFWLGTKSKNLHKIVEKTNVCIVKDKHSDSNIFGRCAYNGQTMEEILMSRDTVVFLLQYLGFVLNLEKFILNPVTLKMCLSLPQEKVLKRIFMLEVR